MQERGNCVIAVGPSRSDWPRDQTMWCVSLALLLVVAASGAAQAAGSMVPRERGDL